MIAWLESYMQEIRILPVEGVILVDLLVDVEVLIVEGVFV